MATSGDYIGSIDVDTRWEILHDSSNKAGASTNNKHGGIMEMQWDKVKT